LFEIEVRLSRLIASSIQIWVDLAARCSDYAGSEFRFSTLGAALESADGPSFPMASTGQLSNASCAC
jgi:hypothetical protein